VSVLNESSLHKGLGVRRPDIAHIRTSPLAGLLHIGPDDEPLVVLAKLLWQVNHVIERITQDLVKQEVLKIGYNLPQDEELNRLNHTQRLMLLAHANPGKPGFAKNSSNKTVSDKRPLISEFWRLRKNPPVPPEQLGQIVLAEEKYERTRIGAVRLVRPNITLQDLLRDFNGARLATVERTLPHSSLFFEVSAAGYVVTVEAGGCEQLPVFTTAEQFEAFAGSGRRPVEATGREVLELLAGHRGVGLSVNPIVGDEEQCHWTALEVARLREDARRGEA